MEPAVIDFVLVPGLACDRRGGRLGYGGGFYDKLLADSLSPCAWLVAGACESQMVEKVPVITFHSDKRPRHAERPPS